MKSSFSEKAQAFKKHFLRDRQLYLLLLIPLIYIGIFHYGPLYGIQIASQNLSLASQNLITLQSLKSLGGAIW